MNNFLLKKVSLGTTKIERKAHKWGKVIRVVGRVGAIGVGIFLALWVFIKISLWYDENRFVFTFPVTVKFHAPIRVERRQIAKPQVKAQERAVNAQILPIKKERTEFEIVNSQRHGQILWKIYYLETQRGLTDYCRINGTGYGGFGVLDDKSKVVCYESFEKAVERAEYWFNALEPDKSLVGALCAWNIGTKGLVNCQYYQDYLSL